MCEESGLGLAVEQMLTADGCTLSRGDCHADAVESVREASPDVLVLEARVRNSQALGLCQSVRADPTLASVKVLVLQDAARPIDRRRAAAVGADGVLAMPFEMAALKREVDRLFHDG